jgi:ligand-binding sensor domain-containing protein/signal transduction histidine kinase
MIGLATSRIGRAGWRLWATSLALLAVNACATGLGTGWLDRAWQTDDGMPDNGVVGVTQAPDGYLWVATGGGLVRFDGIRFQKSPQEEWRGSLRALHADGRGAIWLGLDRGRVVCLAPTGTRVFTVADGLPNLIAAVIVHDQAGAAWVGYASGEDVARIQDGKVARFGTTNGLPGSGPGWLATDTRGQVWFARGSRVGQIQDGQFRAGLELKDPVTRIVAAKSGGLWLCAGGRLLHWNEGREPEERAALPPGISGTDVRALFEDHAGAIWVGTAAGGLLRWDGAEWTRVQTSHAEITCLAEDREGDLWAGTKGGGLNRVRPRLLEVLGSEAGLPFESLRSVAQDASGAMWTTTASGALLRQQTNGWAIESAGTNWPGGRATCMTADRQGGVWVGTEGAGLYQVRPGPVRNWQRRDGLASNFIRSLLVGTDGDLWIATDNTNRLHRLHDGTLHPLNTPARVHALRTMAQDAEGTIWLGSSWGDLLRVQGDAVVEHPATQLAHRVAIRCLLATPDGSLWIGYAGAGLGHLKSGHYTRLTSAEGLAEDQVTQMLEDNSGRLWFAGPHGFSRISQAELLNFCEGRAQRVHAIHYGMGEAVSSPQAVCDFCPGACRSRDGRLWFATRKGLALVHTENLRDNREPPPVFIERAAVDGRIVAWHDSRWLTREARARIARSSTSETGPRILPSHHRIDFEFTAPSLPAPENVRFRYRLEGFDEDWTEVGTPRTATYSRLPAGRYRFRVLACNNTGVWNDAGATLDFTVAPFFWQTWWFRFGLISGVALLVGGTVRYWSQRRLRRELELMKHREALEKERARIARDLHDDLGSRLTEINFIGGFSEAAEAEPAELRARFDNIVERTQRMTRSLDEIVWAVNPANDTLKATANYLCSRAQESLRAGNVRCRLAVAEDLPELPLPSEARHNLLLAVFEAVTNAMKHAEASEVLLRFAVQGENLVIRVEDNGKGFDPTVARDGRNGLVNMRRRCRELGGECVIESTAGNGAAVQLMLPLAQLSAGKTSH